jgi:hypothetical protein
MSLPSCSLALGPVVVGPLPRTAVLVGAGSTPPGVDLDRIAASISSAPATIPNPAPGPPSRQFGGRIAERLSGAAQNLKSRCQPCLLFLTRARSPGLIVFYN